MFDLHDAVLELDLALEEEPARVGQDTVLHRLDPLVK
jgi:hypothetical protein